MTRLKDCFQRVTVVLIFSRKIRYSVENRYFRVKYSRIVNAFPRP